jgi:hypothetical protein
MRREASRRPPSSVRVAVQANAQQQWRRLP